MNSFPAYCPIHSGLWFTKSFDTILSIASIDFWWHDGIVVRTVASHLRVEGWTHAFRSVYMEYMVCMFSLCVVGFFPLSKDMHLLPKSPGIHFKPTMSMYRISGIQNDRELFNP